MSARSLKKDIAIICAAIVLIIVSGFLVDALLDFNLFKQNGELISNYEKMDEILVRYSDSKTDFRLYNRNREWEYMEGYLRGIQQMESMLEALEPEMQQDRDCRMYYRIVVQMIEYRGECVEKFISNEPIPESNGHELEYLNILHDRIGVQLNTLMSHYSSFINDKNQESVKRYEKMQGAINFAVFGMVILLLTAAYMIVHRILRTFSGINRAAQELASNNFAVADIEAINYQEVNIFIDTINNMKHAINLLIEETKEFAKREIENEHQRRLLAETKMEMLQMQINPHFLFNTLSLAIRSIQRDEKENSILLIKSTSEILRASMKTKNLKITLDEEIELLKSYIYIQQLHLQNRAEFLLDIRKSYSDEEVYVPPLVLQPIVENCVFHGMKDVVKGGKVRICITEYVDYMEAVIEDNGAGMAKEKIDELFRQKNAHRIGLSNVLERLRMFYKKEDVLGITSEPGKGTRVVVKFYKKKEAE